MAIILTDENFDKEIQPADKLALVDFYATWCEPCSMLAPVLEKVATEFQDKIVLLKANVDETPINSQKFQEGSFQPWFYLKTASRLIPSPDLNQKRS